MTRPAEIFPLAGTPAVVGAKVRAFFQEHREARLARAGRLRAWGRPLVGLGILVTVLSAGIGAYGLSTDNEPLALAMMGLLLGVPAIIGGAFMLSGAQDLDQSPDLVPDLQGLLRAVLPELHPKGKVVGEIDLREASRACSAERTAKSPYSGATKAYYRHRWFRLAGQLADGAPFAIEATSLVKTKGGGVVRKTLQVRGRFVALGGQLDDFYAFNRLRAVGSTRDGRSEVLFWGTVGALDEIVPDLQWLGWTIVGAESAANPPVL